MAQPGQAGGETARLRPTPSSDARELGPFPPLGAIVVAAGESRRMDGVDKTFVPFLGIPLVAHSVQTLESSPLVSGIVLVLSPARVKEGRALVAQQGWRKVLSVVPGGVRRQDSVLNGLEVLPGERFPWVLVHDGARPCLEPLLVERGLAAAMETGAAVAAVPAKDTIKVVSTDGLVQATPPRETLWMVQTPQVFRHDILLEAHSQWRDAVTDDAAMVEGLGYQVKVFMGSYSNLKVTTPEDLVTAETFLRALREGVAS